MGGMEFEGRLRARYKSFAEVTGNAEWASQRGIELGTGREQQQKGIPVPACSNKQRDARPRMLGAKE